MGQAEREKETEGKIDLDGLTAAYRDRVSERLCPLTSKPPDFSQLVLSWISPANGRSQSLMEKIGFPEGLPLAVYTPDPEVRRRLAETTFRIATFEEAVYLADEIQLVDDRGKIVLALPPIFRNDPGSSGYDYSDYSLAKNEGVLEDVDGPVLARAGYLSSNLGGSSSQRNMAWKREYTLLVHSRSDYGGGWGVTDVKASAGAFEAYREWLAKSRKQTPKTDQPVSAQELRGVEPQTERPENNALEILAERLEHELRDKRIIGPGERFDRTLLRLIRIPAADWDEQTRDSLNNVGLMDGLRAAVYTPDESFVQKLTKSLVNLSREGKLFGPRELYFYTAESYEAFMVLPPLNWATNTKGKSYGWLEGSYEVMPGAKISQGLAPARLSPGQLFITDNVYGNRQGVLIITTGKERNPAITYIDLQKGTFEFAKNQLDRERTETGRPDIKPAKAEKSPVIAINEAGFARRPIEPPKKIAQPQLLRREPVLDQEAIQARQTEIREAKTAAFAKIVELVERLEKAVPLTEKKEEQPDIRKGFLAGRTPVAIARTGDLLSFEFSGLDASRFTGRTVDLDQLVNFFSPRGGQKLIVALDVKALTVKIKIEEGVVLTQLAFLQAPGQICELVKRIKPTKGSKEKSDKSVSAERTAELEAGRQKPEGSSWPRFLADQKSRKRTNPEVLKKPASKPVQDLEPKVFPITPSDRPGMEKYRRKHRLVEKTEIKKDREKKGKKGKEEPAKGKKKK